MGLNSTTNRVIRGPKAKLFLYFCIVIGITGLIACYNSTLTQLEDLKKSYASCTQQQETLSTQLHVISEYKHKLEKSLKNEKAEHQQVKSSWEIKINDEKNRNQQLSNDALMKYNSLQQHYKLLQTEFDDFKEESSNVQKKQLEEVNSLQAKLKEIEEKIKKVEAAKESVKTQLTGIELENIQLKQDLKNAGNNESQLTVKLYTDQLSILNDKYSRLKKICGETEDIPDALINPANNKASEKTFVNLPALKLAENPSSSTKAVPKSLSSGAPLNGAIPLNLPSVTPETVKKPANLKAPQGVVQPPENRENQNEQPELLDSSHKKSDGGEAEKDNGAQEEFDVPVNNNAEGLGFPDENLKQNKENLPVERNIVEKRHEDAADYKDLQREEEDDDADEYGQVKGDDAAIRN